jgi:hypothetical protein
MPEYSAKDSTEFESSNGMYLSSKYSSDTYSVEYNFIGNDTTMICSYIDNNNYHYINLKDNVLSFGKVNSGNKEEIQSVSFNKNYDYSKLHTVRLQHRQGKVSIYFDNMNKINLTACSLSGGKVGYVESNNLTICYTAFSNVAQGSSDNVAIHQNKVSASNYYSSNFKKSSLVRNEAVEGNEELFNDRTGSYDLNLKSKGDYATYCIYATDDGAYGIDMTIKTKYAGKKVLIKVDNETPIRMTIPSANNLNSDYFKVTLGDVNLTKGIHYLSIICQDEIEFSSFEYFKTSNVYPQFEHDLGKYVETGVRYINSWKVKENGHYALAGNRNLVYFGDETFTDFTIEVDIELVGDTHASTCGLILRADNPAFSISDTVSSIQGYYVGFNTTKVFISKCNYHKSIVDVSAVAHKNEANTSYHLKVEVRGNKITLDFNNGAEVLTFVDDIGFTHGSIGFYTDGAAAIYRNLKIYK